MPTKTPLGEFEVVVLMAVLHLGEDGYGSTVLREIARRTGRSTARGAVYITLERLEDKGLLTSKMARGTSERGGRPKRLFRVTTRGTAALRRSVAAFAQMYNGLEPILGDS